MMKRAVCWLLLIVLCFSLSACGSNSTETTPDPVAADSSADALSGEVKDEPEATEEPKVSEEEEATEESGSDTIPVKLGKTIKNKKTSFTLSAFEVVKKYNLEYQEDAYYSRAATVEPYSSGMVLVCIRGKIKNLGKKKVIVGDNLIRGLATINGSEYEMQLECYDNAEPIVELVSKQSSPCYFYAEVPKGVAKKIKKCDVKFGLTDDTESGNILGGIEDLSKVYELTIKPKNKL